MYSRAKEDLGETGVITMNKGHCWKTIRGIVNTGTMKVTLMCTNKGYHKDYYKVYY